ncbi:hypothetical protein RhiJN_16353 [Ceratobasidium sp. AG-Ba]|nr:hypothetical protein RhiJN_16353 [Ceratobasidium sp. AG-Ba]
MFARRTLNTSRNIALDLLQGVADSVDIFPPLQSVAKDALRIINVVKEFRSNTDEWEAFGTYIQETVTSVLDLVARAGMSNGDIKDSIQKLHQTVLGILNELEAERAISKWERWQRYRHDSERIANMRTRVGEVTGLFQLTVTTTNAINLQSTLDAVRENSKVLTKITQGISSAAQNATLDKLQVVRGASWDMSRGCLENTRVGLIKTILAWIDGSLEAHNKGEGTQASIMLLTAVAGAGKTTVAHTVARICAERKQLASSFFFDRESETRNNPMALFTTIAADLSRMDRRIADRVTMAIEEDGRLPTAPISNQFMHLVLNPCQGVTFERNVLIVIDALDEAWDDCLLEILRDQACRLPCRFRIFLTSRLRPELASLRNAPHVRSLELDIDDEANTNDMTLFVPHKLRALAKDMNLEGDWPGEVLMARLIQRAGGLFQWITTVCEYLRQYDDPTAELESLLSSTDPVTSTAEEKMDRLYAAILESCNWQDKVFVESYHRVMGTAIASKAPISITTMEQIHGKQPIASERTLLRLSPLLTGISRNSITTQPVRVLHQSLRDFLVVRSQVTPQFARFYISETENSQNLAELCVGILNREMKRDIPATGYLAEDTVDDVGVPKPENSAVSEALWYACRFWPDHVCDIHGPSKISEGLEALMKGYLVKWLELTASHGRCRELGSVRRWLETRDDSLSIPTLKIMQEGYGGACTKLAKRLEYDDRWEEALVIAEEAVDVYRKLSEAGPTRHEIKLAKSLLHLHRLLSGLGRGEEALLAAYISATGTERPPLYDFDLAGSLNNLSKCLSEMGRAKEAMEASQEAVEIYRRMTAERPAAYALYLARSLNNLSGHLSEMGRAHAAIEATQEAIEIYRGLAIARPTAYAPDFARSLNHLSKYLSEMGRANEAVKTIQEAIEIYRRLAAERPAVYAHDLALSLNNLSKYLSEMGRANEAMQTLQEAIEVFRRLAIERPAAYAPHLATCINNLSKYLSDMGRADEAMETIQEAIEIYRRPAAGRPGAYAPGLAGSLTNFSMYLSETRREKEAMEATQEATEIYRKLAAERPAAYAPGLAGSLNNLSSDLSDMDRVNEATKAIQEAIEIYRGLTAERPAAYALELARSLHNYSCYLRDLHRHNDALPAIQESVQLYKHHLSDRPLYITPMLQRALRSYVEVLQDLGHREQATAAEEEANELSI